jgi:hypothetical protein
MEKKKMRTRTSSEIQVSTFPSLPQGTRSDMYKRRVSVSVTVQISVRAERKKPMYGV